MTRSQKGFSLTEVLIVLLVTSVSLGMLYTVFIANWGAYEDRIRRAQMWKEANYFFEQLSVEARNARSFTIDAEKSVTFTMPDGATVIFAITNAGNLERQTTPVKTFGTHAVFADSRFARTDNDNNLIVDLKLKDTVLTRTITVTASTEILARNSSYAVTP